MESLCEYDGSAACGPCACWVRVNLLTRPPATPSSKKSITAEDAVACLLAAQRPAEVEPKRRRRPARPGRLRQLTDFPAHVYQQDDVRSRHEASLRWVVSTPTSLWRLCLLQGDPGAWLVAWMLRRPKKPPAVPGKRRRSLAWLAKALRFAERSIKQVDDAAGNVDALSRADG